MIKNGEKTTAYLSLSKDAIGGDNINVQIKEDRIILVAHSESTSEVKSLIGILNDETIDGCIIDYSEALGYQSPLGGGVVCVDDYIRKNGVIIFFSSKGWDPDFDDIISVKHEEAPY